MANERQQIVSETISAASLSLIKSQCDYLVHKLNEALEAYDFISARQLDNQITAAHKDLYESLKTILMTIKNWVHDDIRSKLLKLKNISNDPLEQNLIKQDWPQLQRFIEQQIQTFHFSHNAAINELQENHRSLLSSLFEGLRGSFQIKEESLAEVEKKHQLINILTTLRDEAER